MKKVLLQLLIFLFIFSSNAFAHEGFEKRVGNILIDINQTPVSPLVGETVDIYVVFKDESKKIDKSISDKNLTNWPVDISVIDTYYGDETKDKVIYKKGFKTDLNGGIDFTYTFNKANYFDIEFALKDSKGNLQKTGFLIQTRNPLTIALPYTIGAFFIGILLFYLFNKSLKK